ncbi:phosphatase PAP2 family protein [Streptomyces phaeochromogenes]|uniref:Phosphatase PAP2 family protein n=1 Tax=Streptomyces phaeochromogenes TaxID=1923 RepID=A0ABZ1HF69_STRPH|nr:phosphatase PAP2 family protein [Streptomyces phaeochromogenes]MCX5603429.1 phosphatase PAP2 family protein [Streptomyces phaeochromogenes]WRZ30612.1 phosphatase PAP2 family protein [Streptomyces phaeochromogenes]WSD16218.1 phosphatase PAP2 family protein [Streptomyces phaeochromogenes]WSJ06957.1 phosphatase PAP2 family protein [Streptomyces phaeochromogenes]WSS94771.1 phosphatase PAP2 family protein [Streptomyces phaeochromogenes]
MAGLAESGSNPDVDLLYDINGLAKDAPHWFDRVMEFVGEWGLLLAMVMLVLWCWLTVRKRGGEDAASSVAALIWAPLAAGVAVLVNVPIRGFVERPRPFVDHDGLDVLIGGKSDFSFVSDHSTLMMAMGVGLFVANRKFGLVGIVLALFGGFCRVYMGVHYPTDVIGGFALGTAVVLLLSPLAMALLTPVVAAVERSPRVGWLVRARGASGERGKVIPGARSEVEAEERDLAA